MRGSQGRLRHLLRNAAQFNLIKAARRIRGEHAYIRSSVQLDADRYRGIFCGAATRFRARRGYTTCSESGAVSCHARVSCFRVPHFRSPARCRTYFPTRPLRDRIYLQNVSGAHLTPAPRLTAADLYMRWVIAPGIFRRSGPTKTSQRLPFDAASPPGSKIFPRDL